MTLQQVGPTSFDAAEGKLHISDWARGRSPKKVLAGRAENDGGGLLGYLKGLSRDFTIRFNEGFKGATFKLIEGGGHAWSSGAVQKALPDSLRFLAQLFKGGEKADSSGPAPPPGDKSGPPESGKSKSEESASGNTARAR